METFTVGSLRRVLAAFHVASLYRVKLEDYTDQPTSNKNQRVVTHVLSWELKELVQWLQQITGVDIHELESILPILIFDNEPERVTLAHKPLVLGANNQAFLSPRLFLSLPLSHLIVGSLNLSDSTKSAYNSVSTSIEKALLNRISSEISIGPLQNSQLVKDQTFKLSDGSEITPDLVWLSSDNSELLIVDLKNASPPFGVGDIVNDLKEWSEKWRPQLNRYVEAFKQDSTILTQHFEYDNATPKVFGLILLRWPFPIPLDIPDEFGVIDWPTLRNHLSSETNVASIEELCEWIRERPDVAVVKSFEWKQKEPIQVGEWMYKYSVLSPSTNN